MKSKKTTVKKLSNRIDKSEEGIVYEFPEAEKISIDKSNLQIQLNKFKEKIKSSPSIFDLLAIISLWSPIFSANFKSILGISPGSVEAAYIVFASIITITIIYLRLKSFIISDKDVDINPEKMAKKILEQCQKKNK